MTIYEWSSERLVSGEGKHRGDCPDKAGTIRPVLEFRCESIVLRSYWVLVVMDQFTRRLIGVGVHRGAVTGGRPLPHVQRRHSRAGHTGRGRFYAIQANAARAASSESVRAAARTLDGTQSGNGTSWVTWRPELVWTSRTRER
jgi:hypothetical protein